MMRLLRLAAVLVAALPLAPAFAGIPVDETMTCPIGGGRFTYTTTASYSTYGSRPDGKPYGSWTFPLALAECPDNGLVIFKTLSSGEIDQLRPLVASEAYQSLRATDTQYYRAYWLMNAMGMSPSKYLWVLLQASWEADDKPDLRARYLSELARMSAEVTAIPADLSWLGMEVRSANALRELGRFDEALARLDAIPPSAFDVAASASTDAQEEAEERREWRSYIPKLRSAIARRDQDMEPFDLIPRDQAIAKCVNQADSLSISMKAFCTRESAAVESARRR